MKMNHNPIERFSMQYIRWLIGQRKDIRWTLFWLSGLSGVWLWNSFFLNPLAYELIRSALFNTFFGASAAVLFSLSIGWALGIALYFFEEWKLRGPHLVLTFILNLIRSIPQIVGLLIGYILLTWMINIGVLQSHLSQILWMAFIVSLFCSLEVSDLVGERIAYFRTSDYFHAMLCCGMKESRIINVDILWKSSRSHFLHKLVSLFGVAILLQCSIDFIVSIGLSTDVSLSNFPVTLGSLLAKLDSKQDILAMGSMLMDASYLPRILFQHLQGVTVAFVLVFTLMCIFQIADGLAEHYEL
jgi:ABC-type methionine transport system permease subunit